MSDRLFILGRDCGTYEDWDEGDPGVLILRGIDSSVLPLQGDLVFDFNLGVCKAYSEDGSEVGYFDIVEVFSKIPK